MLHQRMENDNSRRMGPVSTQRGVQTRIIKKPEFIVVKKTTVSQFQSKVFLKEVPVKN